MNRLFGLTLCSAAALVCAPAVAAAAKRDPYPPARLWYRVAVEFSGVAALTDDRSGLPSSFGADWKLESRNAIRLTLMCVNVRPEFPNPFVVKERIRGRAQRVGGCPRPTRRRPQKNLRETVRFAATATGEVTRWEHDDPIDFIAGCPGRMQHYELVERQALTGQLSSASSATDGLHVSADLATPFATYTTTAPAIQCTSSTGTPYEKPAIATSGVPFGPNSFFGDETYVNYELASEQLALRFPPRKFGRDHSYTRRLSQPEDLTRSRAVAPAGPYFLDPFSSKAYSYTVRFTACPQRGRAVKRC
jgi:hypothetical protein